MIIPIIVLHRSNRSITKFKNIINWQNTEIIPKYLKFRNLKTYQCFIPNAVINRYIRKWLIRTQEEVIDHLIIINLNLVISIWTNKYFLLTYWKVKLFKVHSLWIRLITLSILEAVMQNFLQKWTLLSMQ